VAKDWLIFALGGVDLRVRRGEVILDEDRFFSDPMVVENPYLWEVCVLWMAVEDPAGTWVIKASFLGLVGRGRGGGIRVVGFLHLIVTVADGYSGHRCLHLVEVEELLGVFFG
jgi:hypothetical protein